MSQPKSSRKTTRQPWHGQPGDGENSAFPSPEGGPGGKTFVHFVSVPPLAEGHLSWVDSKQRTASSLSPTMPPITSSQEIGVRGCGAFWAIQHNFPSLHHCWYVDCPFGATCIEFRSMACTAQPVLAHSESLTRLCDSDHQVTPQIQRRPQDFGDSPRCLCPVRGDCSPIGQGCNRDCPSGWDEVRVLQPWLHRVQEGQWLSTNSGSVSFESVQKLPFSSSCSRC